MENNDHKYRAKKSWHEPIEFPHPNKLMENNEDNRQINALPVYFAIKKDESNPIWDKYLSWWCSMYGEYAIGLPSHYQYYGRSIGGAYSNGFMAATELKYFDERTVEITLEDWYNQTFKTT